MAKYSIKDFNVGDQVYHLSKARLLMVVVELHNDTNEISCRWVDNDGKTQRIEFMPEELGKGRDLGPRMVSIVP
jgi:uncharacterized protein YodC (DUF2158 family)